MYIINTGSNDKAIPKTICLAFRYDEAPVADNRDKTPRFK